MITKVVTYFHANSLYDIAVRAARIENKDPDGPLISIMFSVIALEAFINESGSLARTVPTADKQSVIQGYAEVMDELEQRKEGIILKLHLALLLFSGSTLNKDDKLLAELTLLIALRNEITHPKGDVWQTPVSRKKPDPERSLLQYPKFIIKLHQKHIIPSPTISSSWLDQINTMPVANWACAIVEKISKRFYDSVPDGYYKHTLSTLLLQRPTKPSSSRHRSQ